MQYAANSQLDRGSMKGRSTQRERLRGKSPPSQTTSRSHTLRARSHSLHQLVSDLRARRAGLPVSPLGLGGRRGLQKGTRGAHDVSSPLACNPQLTIADSHAPERGCERSECVKMDCVRLRGRRAGVRLHALAQEKKGRRQSTNHRVATLRSRQQPRTRDTTRKHTVCGPPSSPTCSSLTMRLSYLLCGRLSGVCA